MASGNVDLVRRMVEAFTRQDVEELAALCDEDTELVFGLFTGVDAGGTPYRGTEFWPSYFARVNDTWAEWRVEIVEVYDAGNDEVAAVFRVVGKGRASGVPVEQEAGGVFTVLNGKLARMRTYPDPADALEAAGLMPPDPTEVVSATYAAWNSGEWGLELFHPQVECEFMGNAALDQAGPTRGREALLDYWRRFWAAWRPGARWDIDELRSVGDDQVLVCGRLRAVGRSSGVQASAPIFHLWTVREGLIVRLIVCDDRATALKCGGH